MIRTSQDEVRDNFDRTIDRVAESHEPVIIQRDGRDFVAIVPADSGISEASAEGCGDDEPLWRKIAKLSAEIPREEWAKLPKDMSINVDHYLYGSPKIEE